jgi:hypothetical protein
VTDAVPTNLLFLAFGAVGLWRNWRHLGPARASARWPRAAGEIDRSELRVVGYDEDGEPERRTSIRYRYRVGGDSYTGARVFFGDSLALRFAGPGRRRLAAYPAGRAVEVAYDPADPTRAVLEPGAGPAAYLACAVPAGVALLGAVGLLGAS